MSDKSLSEILGFYRCERPDEWSMDEFIRDAKKLEAKVAELQSKLDEIEKQEPIYQWRVENEEWLECTKEWFNSEMSKGYEKRILLKCNSL